MREFYSDSHILIDSFARITFLKYSFDHVHCLGEKETAPSSPLLCGGQQRLLPGPLPSLLCPFACVSGFAWRSLLLPLLKSCSSSSAQFKYQLLFWVFLILQTGSEMLLMCALMGEAKNEQVLTVGYASGTIFTLQLLSDIISKTTP